MRPFPLSILVGCAMAAWPVLARADADDKALAGAGVPALGRAWSGDDYALVGDLVTAGTVPLPRYADAQGKLLLQRITATENLAACRDEKLPIDTRMANFGQLLNGTGKILDRYQAEANQGADVHVEAARLSAFGLRTVAVGTQLIDELMPMVPRDDRYNVRMDGIKKFQAGLISMFVNVATSLSQKDFYDAQDLSVLLAAMAETLPKLLRAIPANYQQEIRRKLEAERSNFADARDAGNIRQMLDLLAPGEAAPAASPAR